MQCSRLTLYAKDDHSSLGADCLSIGSKVLGMRQRTPKDLLAFGVRRKRA
jgi:hypothetical protein